MNGNLVIRLKDGTVKGFNRNEWLEYKVNKPDNSIIVLLPDETFIKFPVDQLFTIEIDY